MSVDPRSDSPELALQGYFDDLLVPLDEGAANADAPVPNNTVAKPASPTTTPKPKALTSKPEPSADFREPEAESKKKLQKLLSSAAPKLAQTQTEAVTEPVVDLKTEVATEIVAEPVVAEPIVDTKTVAKDVPELDEAHQAVKAKLEVVHQEAVTEQAPVVEQVIDLSWADNGRPSWAQERFDVLLFSVSGLTLAVPLIALGQIQPLTDELTPLFGQADWFMGLQPTPVGKIRTVNTAKFVMPERYDESFLESAKYVVSIDGLPWGLAVDAVNQPITLEPEDVKWRSERSKRAWLAGTVKEHMCALVDIPTMGQMLQDADKNEQGKENP